jgi:hypothetical protein
MSAPEKSPLARLVLFMFCLSIAGTLVAGVHYYTMDLPIQNAVTVPANNPGSAECLKRCSDDKFFCALWCPFYCPYCFTDYQTCTAAC